MNKKANFYLIPTGDPRTVENGGREYNSTKEQEIHANSVTELNFS